MAAEQALPAFIEPMLATRGQPFDNSDYLFEIKWDGIRMLAFIEGGSYRLLNRHGVDTTERYPELAFLAGLPPGTILDGEMVVLRNGQPYFAAVQSRDKTRSPLKRRNSLSRVEPATLMAFDVLYDHHRSMLALPLLARRQHLDALVRQASSSRLLFSQGIVGQGRLLFAQVRQHDLEGIMAKHVTSSYRPGQRGPDWIKIKCTYQRTKES